MIFEHTAHSELTGKQESATISPAIYSSCQTSKRQVMNDYGSIVTAEVPHKIADGIADIDLMAMFDCGFENGKIIPIDLLRSSNEYTETEFGFHVAKYGKIADGVRKVPTQASDKHLSAKGRKSRRKNPNNNHRKEERIQRLERQFSKVPESVLHSVPTDAELPALIREEQKLVLFIMSQLEKMENDQAASE